MFAGEVDWFEKIQARLCCVLGSLELNDDDCAGMES